jgi:hypothetical protein
VGEVASVRGNNDEGFIFARNTRLVNISIKKVYVISGKIHFYCQDPLWVPHETKKNVSSQSVIQAICLQPSRVNSFRPVFELNRKNRP